MKRELVLVFMLAAFFGSFSLRSSNASSKSDAKKCAKNFVGGVCSQISQARSELKNHNLEELACINNDVYIAQKEQDFKKSIEVKAALFVVYQGLSQAITFPIVQRALAISPTMHATNKFIDELDRIYHFQTPYVKELESDINDGSKKAYYRAAQREKLEEVRGTSPYSSLTPKSSSTTLLSYYSNSSTPLIFDSCSNDGCNTPLFFDGRKN